LSNVAGPPPVPLAYRLALWVSIPVVRGPYRLRAHGLEHLPASGGYVIAANHTSNLDPWPLAVALAPRQLHFMAKQELWKPGLRTIMKALGTFPVRRGESDVAAFQTAVRLVRGGGVLSMFPEGTRRQKGLRKKHQARPHTGTARIALAAKAPLVPAAIKGMDRLSRLGPVFVEIGPPIQLDDLQGMSSREAAQVATDRLWSEIQRLEGELAARG
jgi:1-acyl-sn-glycerol-3-phosphate acyltransferase